MRQLDFFDGAESETVPLLSNIPTSELVTYPNDAAYEADTQGAPYAGNIYYNTTDNVVRYYNGTVWQEIIDESTTQAVENKIIDADTNTITNIDNNEIKPGAAIDVTKLHDGSVDNTEFGHLDGVTSPIQAQIDSKQALSEKDQPNGYAGLDGDGRISESALPITALIYRGTWDASTNMPTLADGTGTTGDVYRVSVAGTQDLGSGSQDYAVGDWVTYNGSIWQRSDYVAAGVISDLDDVDTTGVVNGEVLTYNAGSGTWEPGESGAGLIVQQSIAFVGKGSANWSANAGPNVTEITNSQTSDTNDFLLPTNLKTGFTFTAPQNRELVSVKFKIVDRGSANGDGNVQAFLYDVSSGLPTGTPLSTSTTTGTSLFTSNTGVPQEVTFLMGGTFELVQGTTYAILVQSTDTGDLQLRRDNVDSPDSINVQEDTPDSETWNQPATQETFWYEVRGRIQRGDLILDADSFLSVPPLPNNYHTIQAQTIEIGDGEAAYVTIDRDASTETVLPVSVDNITEISPDDDTIVIARVDGTDLYMGIHDQQKISDGQTQIIQQGSGVTELDDLTDVDTATTSPTTGDILRYDGTNWVPEGFSIQETIIDVTGSGDFDSGSIKIVRTGKTVTLQMETTHTFNTNLTIPSSAAGLIPTWARPPVTVGNAYKMTANGVETIEVFTNGRYRTTFRNWAGGGFGKTSNTDFVITYAVD